MPKPAIVTIESQEPATRVFAEWNPRTLRSARAHAETGNLRLAADLCDALHEDDRAPGAFETRVRGLFRLPFTFQPGPRESPAVLEAIDADWWHMFPEDDLAEFAQWGINLGVALGELIWTDHEDRHVPRLKVWNPRHARYDWQDRTWKVWTVEGETTITPGDGKWVLYTRYGGSRPWARGVWRAVALWWLAKRFAIQDWARYGEVHGAPLRVGISPEHSSQPERQELADDLAEMAADTSLTLPPGFDVKMVEATARTWETFDRQIQAANAGIAIAITGQNLTTEVSEGSFAAAQVHNAVRHDLIAADAENLATTLRAQVVEWWAEFNFGDRRLTPWPRWDTQPPSDLSQAAQTLRQVVDMIQVARQAGLPVDVGALAERFDIPLVEGAPLDLPPPAPRGLFRRATLASGDDARSAPGFIAGQVYADALADRATRAASRQLSAYLDRILTVIAGAQDYEDVRQRVLAAFRDEDLDELAPLIEAAWTLAHLDGRLAAQVDTPEVEPPAES